MRTPFILVRRIAFAAIATAALTTGCSDMPGNTWGADTSASGAGADRQCQVFRSYRDRPYVDLMEACSRQMGEEACRRCLQ